MAEPLLIFVPGQCIPKARARVGKGHGYTPKTTETYQHKVRVYARAAGAKPLMGPLSLVAIIRHGDNQPRDTDNCLKGLQDSLNGIAWADDRQIKSVVAISIQPRDPGSEPYPVGVSLLIRQLDVPAVEWAEASAPLDVLKAAVHLVRGAR